MSNTIRYIKDHKNLEDYFLDNGHTTDDHDNAVRDFIGDDNFILRDDSNNSETKVETHVDGERVKCRFFPKNLGDYSSVMTDEEYAGGLGNHCPNNLCDGEGSDLETSGTNCDAGIIMQDITCNKCGADWRDDYLLTGHSRLTIPDKQK